MSGELDYIEYTQHSRRAAPALQSEYAPLPKTVEIPVAEVQSAFKIEVSGNDLNLNGAERKYPGQSAQRVPVVLLAELAWESHL